MCGSALYWPPTAQGWRMKTHQKGRKSPFKGEVKNVVAVLGRWRSRNSSRNLSSKMREDGSHSRQKASRKSPAARQRTRLTFRNPREKPAQVRDGDGSSWPHEDQEPPGLLPSSHNALVLVCLSSGFLFMCFTEHHIQHSDKNLSIVPWNWSHKSRAIAQLQELCLAVPHSTQCTDSPFWQIQNKIFLTVSNNCSCYSRPTFTEEHINCSIDKLELSVQLEHALNISVITMGPSLYQRQLKCI